VATRLGPFAPFVAFWAVMMAAMMLPAAVPAVLQRARADGRISAVLLFVGTYLLVWTLFGVVVYAVYRPHGTSVAGLLVIAAGVYEFTRVKRESRRRCRERAGSGLAFGLSCAGSSIGLMVMLVALGVMSIPWMVLIALLVLAQKLFPARAAVDVPVALAIVALGVLILIAPSVVPGIMPSMSSM
jgi:predicted metal-binding membrane protein